MSKNRDNTTKDSAASVGLSYKVEIDETKKRIDDLDKRVNETQIQVIQMVGIFVALFTFVSIDFEIFKGNVSYLASVGVSLIALGGLAFFVLLLFFTINYKDKDFVRNNKFIYILLFIVIIILTSGACLVGYESKNYLLTIDRLGGDKQLLYNKEKIDDLLKNKLEKSEFRIFKDCLKNGQWDKCLQ